MSKTRITMQELAGRLGLSLKAVSDGINGTGRLSAQTRERILAAVRETGYRRNSAARALASRSSRLIGVLMPFTNSSFFGNISAGIESRMLDGDYMLLLGNISGSRDTLRQHIRRFAEREVEGIIVYPSEAVREAADELLSLRVPVVQIMESCPKLGKAAVMVDNEKAGREAARHLRELGHTKIGFLAHDRSKQEIISRRRGFLEELGYAVPEEECAFNIPDGLRAARKLLNTHPGLTAVFAASDFAALGALQAGLELGRRIPEELAVVGFDNLDIAASQLLYPLTTLSQPKEEIGRLAGDMLIGLIRGGEPMHRILEAPLIIRASTIRPPGTGTICPSPSQTEDLQP